MKYDTISHKFLGWRISASESALSPFVIFEWEAKWIIRNKSSHPHNFTSYNTTNLFTVRRCDGRVGWASISRSWCLGFELPFTLNAYVSLCISRRCSVVMRSTNWKRLVNSFYNPQNSEQETCNSLQLCQLHPTQISRTGWIIFSFVHSIARWTSPDCVHQ